MAKKKVTIILCLAEILDLFHGLTTFAWGMGFLTMGLGCALGPVVLAVLGREIGRGTMKDPSDTNTMLQK